LRPGKKLAAKTLSINKGEREREREREREKKLKKKIFKELLLFFARV
jgi:hypothetical protein